MYYNYFIPTIHLGPVNGTKFIQTLPMNRIKDTIIGKKAELEVIRNIFKDGKLTHTAKNILKFENSSWTKLKGSEFFWDSNCKPKEYCYIETQINMVSGKGFTTSIMPAFYVWYINNDRKNFVSCGNLKYGNPRVIMQMEEFGFWVDGYPAVSINKKQDISYSAVIINPYNLKGKFYIEINELKAKKSVVVNAKSVSRIDLNEMINEDEWIGQVYVTGSQRGIIYFMNHSIKNNLKISTLEHSDPYRAELTYKPRLMHLRDLAHRKLKNKLS
ncbi:MAG: hypothetical protein CMJ13_04590 [Pelagibacterales bacterium]|nr:hypothetical protein [Pelagibacterales bacterium]